MEIVRSIKHPEEVLALLKFKLGGCQSIMPKCDMKGMSADCRRCYELLKMTSRSFSAVIQALEGDLRHAVCIFYLVLRALDTVEDDMTIAVAKKVPMLKAFHMYLLDPDWRFMGSKEKDRAVLEEFPVISREFRSLAAGFREVISDICAEMGSGMTIYLERAPGSMSEWDEYCHYVAGVVGIGLSRLFSASGLESSEVGGDAHLANSMGLFLQKTNIIRDFREDVLQGREFWPRAAWGQYGASPSALLAPGRRGDAVACLNQLITNALAHVPDVLTYMGRIRNRSIFCFCAIPQAMAIATLERCYDNPAVFDGVVKIRKGEAVKMMMETSDIDQMKTILAHFSSLIGARIPDAAAATETRAIVTRIAALTGVSPTTSAATYYPLYVSCSLLVGAIVWQYWTSLGGVVEQFTSRIA